MISNRSLDPIEEARALVRLRYMRARRARSAPHAIGLVAQRLVRKKGGKKAPPLARLKAGWREIAGEKLYKYCRPEKLTGGKAGRTLVLRCLPAAAPMIQHQSEIIRQRVSVAAGGDITGIKIVQGPLPGAAPAKPIRRESRPLSPAQRTKLEERAAKISDKGLREAIVSLGSAVLTGTESPKS